MKKQKALPLSVLRFMNDRASSDLDKVIATLLIGAHFFAMRSCEYLKTSSREESKRTHILRIKNFTFIKNQKVVPIKSKRIMSADLVRIVFEFQKSDKRNQSVHMWSTKDKVLNPVLAWGKTILRLWSTIPNASLDTKVCSFFSKGKLSDVTSNVIRSHLRAAVDVIGEGVLGFTSEDIGLHSIRSGGAMSMFLSGVHEIVIKRIGRWSSEAFLEYIREQVDTFSVGVSEKMLENESFFHLNDKDLRKHIKDVEMEDKSSRSDGEIQHVPFTVHYSKSVLDESISKQFASISI